jgi:hypothetical protein
MRSNLAANEEKIEDRLAPSPQADKTHATREPNDPMHKLRPSAWICALMLALAAASAARAQSSCSSDGVPQPVALLERFTNADCQSCWSDAHTPQAGPRELALDWIVPGSAGEDAPLAAGASSDAVDRLAALGRETPPQAATSRRGVQGARRTLRVAHGLAFNRYIGASIELKPGSGGPWQAWLLLVETLPAGTEGSPVARNLVRNALRPAWDTAATLSKQERMRLFESRPMNIPAGARPDRLRVVGWVEDARGRVRAIAQSRCVPAGKG